MIHLVSFPSSSLVVVYDFVEKYQNRMDFHRLWLLSEGCVEKYRFQARNRQKSRFNSRAGADEEFV